ncbi:putative TPR-repeat-containing chaperone protein DNAJ,putative [Trypanosoma conorhini]|uniref:Putative TPR-repeat-containing chaperone protein DNAJ,putative n=1 Tax=Trypanosoma conorhini TaxID=83891 RepID=A0A3R7M615_9TRYP|nr:putative TPR-repeat-containing chaperone protein DNAJ,putative [Trypanosoma conorhini]RNF27232.1 putative TPR-repeat-containing chaperone protein DNAJ,putative [Trypanosoma conorhini]
MIANEAIDRKRLVRMLQGCLPELNISFTKNEERGMRLLASRDYGGAYVSFTRALQQNPQSKIAYYKRAVCSWHLLLYDECIEDARKGGEIDLDLVSLHGRSLLLRERYPEARQCYAYALQALAPSTQDPHNVKWCTESGAITALQQFRDSVKGRRWEEALRVKDAAKPLIDGTPLLLLEARALLHLSPNTARLRLLSYVPTIPRPASAHTEMSWEEKEAWRGVEEHYLHAAVLLAQASAYCGSAFLELAAALIQTCLTISPSFGPALLLGHYLVSLEEILSRVNSLFARERYAEAIPLLHEGLLLDKSNRLMCGALYCMRAEAYASLGNNMNVIRDCAAALWMDPKCARAFVLRAEAYQQTRQRAEAAADRLSAVRLDPALRHILRGDEEQFLPQPEFPRATFSGPGAPRRRPKWYDAFATETGPPPESPSAENGASRGTERVPNSGVKQTLYEILELPRGASIAEARAQFKKLTLLYHPDRVVTETLTRQQAAMEQFKLINHAHEVLTDPSEKFLYDLSLGQHFSPGL